MKIHFKKLTKATSEIAQAFSRWENDLSLIPFMRPNKNKNDLKKQRIVSLDDLAQRLEHCQTYLIYLDAQLIGQMNYQVDSEHLFKKEPATAWIGIGVGEEVGRGNGVGYLAM